MSEPTLSDIRAKLYQDDQARIADLQAEVIELKALAEKHTFGAIEEKAKREAAEIDLAALKSWQEGTIAHIAALGQYREGELPMKGWLRDNDGSRAALDSLIKRIALAVQPAPTSGGLDEKYQRCRFLLKAQGKPVSTEVFCQECGEIGPCKRIAEHNALQTEGSQL